MMKIARSLLALTPFWVFIFLFKLAANLHYTIFPVLGELVFPIWLMGVLIGGASFIQVVLDVPAGYILDRFGYIRLLKVSTVAFFLAACVLFWGIHAWTILLSLIFSCIGWLFFNPGVDAYVLVKAEHRIAGQFMGLRDMMSSAGVVLGMLFLPFLNLSALPFIAFILGVPFLISFISLFRAPRDTASVQAEAKIGRQSLRIRRQYIHHLFKALKKLNPVSTLLLLSSLSSSTFYGVVWFVVPLMIAARGHSGSLGIGLAVFDAAVLFTGFLIGRFSDRFNKRWLIFWGLLLFSVCGLLIGFHLDIFFIVLGFLATTGDEISSVSLWAWLDHLDKEHSEDALVTGSIALSHDIGWMIGPILAGFLYTYLGPSLTIAVGACFVFATWVLSLPLLITHRLKKRAPRPAHG